MDEVEGYLEYDGDIYKIQSVEQLQEFMDSLEDDTDEFDDFCNEDDYYNEWDDYGTSGEKYGYYFVAAKPNQALHTMQQVPAPSSPLPFLQDCS